MTGNYRVEAGQPIAEAFSATAWNRAQDAADIVLGTNSPMTFEPNTSYKYGICVPVSLTNLHGTLMHDSDLPVGTMIEYIAPSFRSDGETAHINYLRGQPAQIRTLYMYETQAVGPEQAFCVTTKPAKATDEFVECCIKGACWLLMNGYTGASGSKVTFPTSRAGSNPEVGRGERADVGYGTLLYHGGTSGLVLI